MRISPAVGYRIEGGVDNDEDDVVAVQTHNQLIDNVFDLSDCDAKYFRDTFFDTGLLI
jgi:hypothetical protein